MQLFEGEEPEFDELSLNFTIDELREALIGGYGAEAAQLQWGTPDAEMVRHLYRNVYQFSVAKNFTQMRTLTSALIDENGHTRSFSDFMNEAAKIDKKFNVDYLRAEYDTAVNSAEMASHWVRFKQMGDPMLRYVTVGDERVRASHAAMNGIQRPMSDPIWDKIYPPNGWNCRCTVVTTTGAATPGKQIRMPWDVPPMFQTNLAKTGMLWPKDHPYFKALPGPTAKRMVEQSDDRYLAFAVNQAVEFAQEEGKNTNTAFHMSSYKATMEIISKTIGLNSAISISKTGEYGTGKILTTPRSIKNAFKSRNHSETLEEKYALLYVLRNPQSIRFTASKPLGAGKDLTDEINRKNIKKKDDQGVTHYNYYNFDYNDKPYTLHMQAIGTNYELIYAVYPGYDRYPQDKK